MRGLGQTPTNFGPNGMFQTFPLSPTVCYPSNGATANGTVCEPNTRLMVCAIGAGILLLAPGLFKLIGLLPIGLSFANVEM